MVIEKLLVNYNEFKWFYEKDKYIKEEVFNEFLECKKLQVEMKEELSFGNKVFLAFDEINTGEINLKKFFLVMELTSKSNINIDKIKFIIQLFEDYNLRYEEKSINISEMNELLKILILELICNLGILDGFFFQLINYLIIHRKILNIYMKLLKKN
jgi:Ca2+-binding EF-hand superfamily protein